MIKLIIFDFSNVCFSLEEPPFLQKFSQEHTLNYEEFETAYMGLVKKAEVGEETGINMWKILLEKYHLSGNPQKIIQEMMDAKEAYWDVLELAKKLRLKGCKTSFFTNYNEDYWKLIENRFDLKLYFDFGIVSFQVKSRKPDAEGFNIILRHFNVKPQEAVFTDDSPNNLVEPRKLGIHVIQFKNLKQLIQELKKLCIEI